MRPNDALCKGVREPNIRRSSTPFQGVPPSLFTQAIVPSFPTARFPCLPFSDNRRQRHLRDPVRTDAAELQQRFVGPVEGGAAHGQAFGRACPAEKLLAVAFREDGWVAHPARVWLRL